MSIKVLGHWEIGYMTPIMEANFWDLILRDFEVSDWHMTPVSGIMNNESHKVPLTEHRTYDDALDKNPDLTRVFIEPRTKHQNPNTTWLHDFEHPKEDCIYVFGSAHYNPTLFHKREGDHVVSIKTVQDKGVLWSNQCLAIVLHDRMIKEKN